MQIIAEELHSLIFAVYTCCESEKASPKSVRTQIFLHKTIRHFVKFNNTLYVPLVPTLNV